MALATLGAGAEATMEWVREVVERDEAWKECVAADRAVGAAKVATG